MMAIVMPLLGTRSPIYISMQHNVRFISFGNPSNFFQRRFCQIAPSGRQHRKRRQCCSTTLQLNRLAAMTLFRLRLFTGVLAFSATCYLTRQAHANNVHALHDSAVSRYPERHDAKSCSLPSEQKHAAATVLRCCSPESILDWCASVRPGHHPLLD
jgi:hypothetical protein